MMHNLLLLPLITLPIILAQAPLPPCTLHLSRSCDESTNSNGPSVCAIDDDCQDGRFCGVSGLCSDIESYLPDDYNHIESVLDRLLQTTASSSPNYGTVYGVYGVSANTTATITTTASSSGSTTNNNNNLSVTGEISIILSSVFVFLLLFVFILYCGRKQRKKKEERDQEKDKDVTIYNIPTGPSPILGFEEQEISYTKLPLNSVAPLIGTESNSPDVTPHKGGFYGVNADYSSSSYKFNPEQADATTPKKRQTVIQPHLMMDEFQFKRAKSPVD